MSRGKNLSNTKIIRNAEGAQEAEIEKVSDNIQRGALHYVKHLSLSKKCSHWAVLFLFDLVK